MSTKLNKIKSLENKLVRGKDKNTSIFSYDYKYGKQQKIIGEELIDATEVLFRISAEVNYRDKYRRTYIIKGIFTDRRQYMRSFIRQK
jgi:hypothetical protein